MISNTRLKTWRACSRKEYLSFDLGLEPSMLPEALRWGSAFHASRAGIAYEADPYVRASVERVISTYQEPIDEIVACEQHFEVEFAGDVLVGDIDAIARIGDRLVIVERKTTSRPVEDLFTRLDIDTQVLTYWIGARAIGFDVTGVLYAVQPKPTQRPRKATPEDKRKYKKDGALYANQRLTDETPDEYAARLEIEPATFREVAVLTSAIERHEREVRAQIAMRAYQREHNLQYRNPQACEDCWFVNVCLRTDLENTVPDGFIRRARVGSVTQLAAS